MSLKICVLVGALALSMGCSSSPRAQPYVASELQADVVGLDKEAVRKRLGAPEHQSSWDTGVPGPDMSAEERKTWEEGTREAIWTYPGVAITFSVSGRVLEVEDDEVPSKYASD